ncbi:unnamed protein product [Ixodes pacificus]
MIGDHSQQRIINGILDNIGVAATEALNTATWIDADSRRLAKLKLRHMKRFLWPDASFPNSTDVDRIYSALSDKKEPFVYYLLKTREVIRRESYTVQNWRLPGIPVPAGMAYQHIFNSISVGVEMLEYPLYYHDGSPAINYGGLGHSFALRLVEAFSGKGVQFSPRGVLTSWWTPQYKDRYNRREKCGKWSSVFPEVPAMEVAFRAFKESAKEEDEGLDLSEKYTGDQVFFMSLCRAYCERQGDLIVSPRCNKAVSNSREFAKAFKCAKGTNMNPASKCSFFGEGGAPPSDPEL